MRLLPILTLFVLATGCTNDPVDYEVVVTGTIEQQGITTYQYGTHVIGNSSEFYALRSSAVDLDDYVGMEVTVYGDLVDGYPITGGPDYVDVKRVEE